MYFMMIPYILLVIVYLVAFKVYSPKPKDPSLLSAFWKCLPIFYLIIIVFTVASPNDNHVWYKRVVSIALLFSMLGDFFLNWFKDYFIPGVACFAVAQICYILAFGFDPIDWEVGLVVALMGAILYSVLYSGIKETPVRVVVAVYLSIIATMAWRATVLYKTTHHHEAIFTVTGAWIFALSDSIIAINAWRWKLPIGVFWIMTTYYIAQGCLALSILVPGWRARMFQFVGV